MNVKSLKMTGLVLGALAIFGGEALFGFSIALMFGIIIGTYSSIYMANPILVWLGVGPHSFVPQQTDAEKAEATLYAATNFARA